jgi:mannose-1-phosphate guanylyltransferase
MKPVIICGGVGTKMWPLSRTGHPKHFLPLFDGKSLFQINYEILLKKFKLEEIYIQTTEIQAKTVFEQEPQIPKSNCFIEPELKNTGPAIGFMAMKLAQVDPDEPFFLVQADVLRDPAEKFLEMIDQCEILVKRGGRMVTGGFRPSYGVMGVDYMVAGSKVENTGEVDIYKIDKFVWRTTDADADKYVTQESIFLHANHYSWTPRAWLESYKKYAPAWYDSLQKMRVFLENGDEIKMREEYAKMEKGTSEDVTQHVFPDSYVVSLPFKWVDFGTWESFFKYRKEHGQYLPGENILEIETKNCFVQKRDKNFVALVGVEDLFVIDTDDALLICKNNQSGKVGDVVTVLKDKKKKEYL